MSKIGIRVKIIMNGVNPNYVITELSLQNIMYNYYPTMTSKLMFYMVMAWLLCWSVFSVMWFGYQNNS